MAKERGAIGGLRGRVSDGGERRRVHTGKLVRFVGRPSGDGIVDAAAAPLEEEGEEGEGEREEGEEEDELGREGRVVVGGGGGRWLLPETRHRGETRAGATREVGWSFM